MVIQCPVKIWKPRKVCVSRRLFVGTASVGLPYSDPVLDRYALLKYIFEKFPRQTPELFFVELMFGFVFSTFQLENPMKLIILFSLMSKSTFYFFDIVFEELIFSEKRPPTLLIFVYAYIVTFWQYKTQEIITSI